MFEKGKIRLKTNKIKNPLKNLVESYSGLRKSLYFCLYAKLDMSIQAFFK